MTSETNLQIIEAAEKLADAVQRLIQMDEVNYSELSTLLMEFRVAQALAEQELAELLDDMEKSSRPVIDYETKQVYNNLDESGSALNNNPKDSKRS